MTLSKTALELSNHLPAQHRVERAEGFVQLHFEAARRVLTQQDIVTSDENVLRTAQIIATACAALE